MTAHDILVFTTGNTEQLKLLRRSCFDHGIDLKTYGENTIWCGHGDTKIVQACEFLKRATQPYALFVDGHDSVFVDTLNGIWSTYAKSRYYAHVLISGERNCWPDASLSKQLSRRLGSLGKYPYPNAGGWMGPRELLIYALDIMVPWAQKTWPDDDQRCWHQLCLERPGLHISVDDHGMIFSTLHGATHAEKSGYCTRQSHHLARIYHFNGRSGINGQAEEFYDAFVHQRQLREI